MANDALIQTAAAPLWKEPKKGAERVDEALCGVSVEILESSGIYRRVRTCFYATSVAADGTQFQTGCPPPLSANRNSTCK